MNTLHFLLITFILLWAYMIRLMSPKNYWMAGVMEIKK